MVAEFWKGVCREFDGITRYLVLILTGSKDAIFPKGVTVLPRPQFDVSDIDLWTRAMVRLHGWPVELADAWTDQLHEESTYQNVPRRPPAVRGHGWIGSEGALQAG